MIDLREGILELFDEAERKTEPKLQRPWTLFHEAFGHARCPHCRAPVEARIGVAGLIHPSGARGCTKAFPSLRGERRL